MLTVVVTGSRDWSNGTRINDAMRWLYEQDPSVTIIHGTARGADTICAEWADTYGFEVVAMPAEWDKYGKSAGFRRNSAMLDLNPDMVIAFWDGSSKGTLHTITEAKKRGIRTIVVR